eukprot:TRINITY_DN16554_c0_g1_i4.p2 TRINITY_DN16554_c0_g1~~TRINITY_DN16554_c0_g1_i4.p2  ORF type:complete len:117 (+),score=33.77 TRINITY_DN16554_c0_g1_i4:45-353(+)
MCIRDSKYAMGTSVTRAAAGISLYQRGAAYGIPGAEVDGMDVVAVQEAAEKAVKHCRSGKGPYLSLIHISEPTRLLSISYAVFCLKKKKIKKKKRTKKKLKK